MEAIQLQDGAAEERQAFAGMNDGARKRLKELSSTFENATASVLDAVHNAIRAISERERMSGDKSRMENAGTILQADSLAKTSVTRGELMRRVTATAESFRRAVTAGCATRQDAAKVGQVTQKNVALVKKSPAVCASIARETCEMSGSVNRFRIEG